MMGWFSLFFLTVVVCVPISWIGANTIIFLLVLELGLLAAWASRRPIWIAIGLGMGMVAEYLARPVIY